MPTSAEGIIKHLLYEQFILWCGILTEKDTE